MPAEDLRLALPEPYDVAWIQWYLAAHTVPGHDHWDRETSTYAGAVASVDGPDLVRIRFVDNAIQLSLASGDRPGPGLVTAVRRLLGLDSDAGGAAAHLARDPALAPAVRGAPGVRVPGALDGWEVLLRTLVGQQISLAAARTHLARLVGALGEALPETPGWRVFPSAAAVAERGTEVQTGPSRRVESVVRAARLVADGRLDLSEQRESAALRRDLLALPGIGPWTAGYVAMRLVSDPDILLDTDLVVRQGAALLGVDLRTAERWAPYRSFATMYLWRAALAARPPSST